jgi:hypothetical protein
MFYSIGQCFVDNSDGNVNNNSDNIKNNLFKNGKTDYSIIAEATELMDNSNYISVSSIDKLGVQARPGSIFAINGEPIRIGKTGTYELIFNEVYVNSLKVLSQDQFLFDYKYIIE